MVKALPSLQSRAAAAAAAANSGTKKTVAPKLDSISRRNLKWVNDYLKANPGQILVVKAHLEEGGLKVGKTKESESDRFHETYTVFKQIKKEYLAGVIAEVGESHGLTAAVLDAVDHKCRYAIRQIAAHLFGVEDGTRIPRPCIDKRVMRAYLVARGEELGSRWRGFKAKCIREDSTLNWQTEGCFSFDWGDNDEVVGINHCNGAVVTDLPVRITSRWKLECNCHDLLAGVSCGMINPRIREFFADDDAVFKSYDDEHCKELAQQCHDNLYGKGGSKKSGGPVLQAAAQSRAEQLRSRRPAPAKEKLGVPLRAAKTT